MTQNPTASSKSLPGVRMVTASACGSAPGACTRISIGSSVTSRSGRSRAVGAVDTEHADGRDRATDRACIVEPRLLHGSTLPGSRQTERVASSGVSTSANVRARRDGAPLRLGRLVHVDRGEQRAHRALAGRDELRARSRARRARSARTAAAGRPSTTGTTVPGAGCDASHASSAASTKGRSTASTRTADVRAPWARERAAPATSAASGPLPGGSSRTAAKRRIARADLDDRCRDAAPSTPATRSTRRSPSRSSVALSTPRRRLAPPVRRSPATGGTRERYRAPRVELTMMRRRFAQARVARLATVSHELRPHVVPVCFSLDGDRIVTRRRPQAEDHDRAPSTRQRACQPLRDTARRSLGRGLDQLWWIRADGTGMVVDPGPSSTRSSAPLHLKYRGNYGRHRPDGPGHRDRRRPLGRLVRLRERLTVRCGWSTRVSTARSARQRGLRVVGSQAGGRRRRPIVRPRCASWTSLWATPPSRTSTRVRTTAACSTGIEVLDDDPRREVPELGLTLVRGPLRGDEVAPAHAVAQLVTRERPQRLEVEPVPGVLVRDRDVVGRRARVAGHRDHQRDDRARRRRSR